jgi:hypothetical protein
MAFLKYANATVIKPGIDLDAWRGFRQKSTSLPLFDKTASRLSLQEIDPKQLLLTHCTIVASVDTENSNAPLGKHIVEGFEIDRKYPDYLITPKTSGFINNNGDSWERKLLLSTFKTFIGGQNYLEHIQVPELSKGRIIDAAARDIGDSIYIDILVATERKHAPLIKAIQGGQLSTLSMGCFTPGTPVTMADGRWVPIEEVVPGDMVLTHKGRTREVLNKQIHIGRWNMRRIDVVGLPDSIQATDNHPFFVIRSAKVCACGCGEPLTGRSKEAPIRRMTKRFKLGHQLRILNPNGSYSLEEKRRRVAQLAECDQLVVEKVKAADLKAGDYVVFPKLKDEVVADPGVGKARLLGYFLAEGSFLKRKGVACEVQFNFSMQEKDTFVAEVTSLLRQEFPQANEPWVQERSDRNLCVVHMTGKSAVNWFKYHGGEYGHRKHLSVEAIRWSAEAHLNLIGAWINGDGNKHSSGSSIGTTTSYDLACQMHLLSMQCGLPVRMECCFGGKHVAIAEAVVNGVSLRHPETGRLAHFNICYSKSSSPILRLTSSKAASSISKSHLQLRVLEDKVIFPISKIEVFEYDGPVFNMEVEEDHSYQVQGLAVANCSVAYTLCTKCGNVAVDETQLCSHVRFFKGNKFRDDMGVERVVAELCFPSGTRVLDGSGTPVAIEDVQIGDLVLTHKGRRRPVTRKFERVYQGPLTTFRVEGFPFVTFRSTPQHPYLTLSPRTVCACGCGKPLGSPRTFGLNAYSRSYLQGHNPNVGGQQPMSLPDFLFKEASQVKVGDTVALPVPTEVILPKDVSEASAEILGWFLAEGSYTKTRGIRTGIQLTLNAQDEMPIAERLCELLKICFEPKRNQQLATTDLRLRKRPPPKISQTDSILGELSKGASLANAIADNLGLRQSFVASILHRYEGLGVISSRQLLKGECPELKGRRRSHTKIWALAEGVTAATSRRFAWSLEPRYVKLRGGLKEASDCVPHIYRQLRPEGGEKLTVTYRNKQAADWLFKHAGEYALGKRLSEDAIFWPLNLQRVLLKGYVHGDGTVDSFDRHSSSSISSTLTTQIQLLAARCGFWTRRQVIFEGATTELCRAVVNSDVVLVGEDGYRPRHELHYQASKEVSSFFDFGRGSSVTALHRPIWHQHAGYMLYKVREVNTQQYSGLVHNIAVEEDDSYLVEGIAVHNCGHSSDPDSVRFIEASWVGQPAFKGAVLRSILNIEDAVASGQGPRIQVAYGMREEPANLNAMQRAANTKRNAFGEQDTEVPSAEPKEDVAPVDPLDKVVEDLSKLVREKVIDRVRSDIGKDEAKEVNQLNENHNESIIKSAAKSATWRRIARAVYAAVGNQQAAKRILLGLILFQRGGWRAVQASKALSGRDVLAVSRILDLSTKRTRMAGEGRIYRVVLAVGDQTRYPTMRNYLAACRQVVGRDLTDSEKEALIDKGRLFSLGS